MGSSFGGRVKNGSSRGARRLELATEAGLFFRFAKLRFQNANEVLQSLFGQWIDGRGCHPVRLVKPPFLEGLRVALEDGDLAVALPELNIVTVDKLLGLFLGNGRRLGNPIGRRFGNGHRRQ
jgi:hypothetical protein